jgi:hypothetical protein
MLLITLGPKMTIVPKLSSANFAIGTVKPFLSQDSLKMIYYSYFHSIMTYRLIFGGNSHYSNTIFKLKKELLESLYDLEVGIHVENNLRN